MCFLKISDLAGGILTYHRHKTGQLLQVKWEKPMQRLIEKFGATDSAYLLPIIDDKNGDVVTQYKSALHRVNRKIINLLKY